MGNGATAAGHRSCELCNCWVAGGEEQWRIHVNGINHRRQVLFESRFYDIPPCFGKAADSTSGRPHLHRMPAALPMCVSI